MKTAVLLLGVVVCAVMAYRADAQSCSGLIHHTRLQGRSFRYFPKYAVWSVSQCCRQCDLDYRCNHWVFYPKSIYPCRLKRHGGRPFYYRYAFSAYKSFVRPTFPIWPGAVEPEEENLEDKECLKKETKDEMEKEVKDGMEKNMTDDGMKKEEMKEDDMIQDCVQEDEDIE